MRRNKGFTLVELVMYSAILAIIGGILTGVLITSIRTQNRDASTNEVTQQLDFTMSTVQRLVRESSLIESVYEGTATGTACSEYCTVRLRMEDSSRDPTIIRSDADGVYVKEGSSEEVPLTTNEIVVDNFNFLKFEVAGGHASVQVDATFSRNTPNPQLATTESLRSAVTRVTAATFDSDLIPNTDNSFDLGQISPNVRWKNLNLSGDLTAAGNVGIGITDPEARFQVEHNKPGLNDAAAIFQSGNCGSPCAQEDYNEGIRVWNGNTNGRVGIGFVVQAEASHTINTVPNVWMGTINNSDAGLARTFVIATKPAGSLVDRLTIKGDTGDVGIGTASPGQKLDVQGGSINTSNALYTGGVQRINSLGKFTNMDTDVWHDSDDGKSRFHFVTNSITYIRSGGTSATTGRIRFREGNNIDMASISPSGAGVGSGSVTASAFFYSSDISLKENIQPLVGALGKVLQLQPVTFNWKDSGEPSIGFIAQDVEKLFPEVVSTSEEGLKSVEYGKLTALIAEAIKEQQAEIDSMREEINSLREEIENLKKGE